MVRRLRLPRCRMQPLSGARPPLPRAARSRLLCPPPFPPLYAGLHHAFRLLVRALRHIVAVRVARLNEAPAAVARLQDMADTGNAFAKDVYVPPLHILLAPTSTVVFPFYFVVSTSNALNFPFSFCSSGLLFLPFPFAHRYEATFRSWALGEKESQKRGLARYRAAVEALEADVVRREEEAETIGEGFATATAAAVAAAPPPFPATRGGQLRQPGTGAKGGSINALQLLRQAVATRGPFKDALAAELAALKKASSATAATGASGAGGQENVGDAELTVGSVKSLGRVAQKQLFGCSAEEGWGAGAAAGVDGTPRDGDASAIKDMVRCTAAACCVLTCSLRVDLLHVHALVGVLFAPPPSSAALSVLNFSPRAAFLCFRHISFRSQGARDGLFFHHGRDCCVCRGADGVATAVGRAGEEPLRGQGRCGRFGLARSLAKRGARAPTTDGSCCEHVAATAAHLRSASGAAAAAGRAQGSRGASSVRTHRRLFTASPPPWIAQQSVRSPSSTDFSVCFSSRL